RNLERMREISEVAVRHGFGYFFERHPLLGLIRPWRHRAPHPVAHRGQHIREMLDELGPTFVKFGQLLSTRPDIVPADIVQELVKLQDHVRPFSSAVAEEVIEEDLGLTLARAFESFETEPMAAASIGQVYRAVLPGGQKVMVKVQRPEAGRQIRKDVDLLLQFAELVEGRVDLGFSPVALVREFARSINRELDYILEARNAERFGKNFKDSPTVQIPRVYWRYSSNRVLTLERIEGPTLNDPSIALLPLEERRTLAETITGCWFKQILHDGFFHADPHPANIVHVGDGKIGLLDFGIAGFLRTEDLEEGTRLFLRVMASDVLGIKRSLKRLGVEWNPSADEAVTQSIEEGFSRYFGMSLANINVASLLHQVFDIVYSLRLRLPSRFLLLDKALLTMEGVVGQLYPDINFFAMARQYAGELQKQRVDPRAIADRLQRSASEYAYVFRDYPMQLHDLLEELRAGELEIKYRHTGLEDMIHRLDIVTNRLVVALLSIALGATSTAAAILVEGGPHAGGLSVWGLPGFAGSLFFGAWLIYSIIRSGRL
ncbi:MAG TPA: AarF/UbiB family protein, partial [Thermoleophilia bacterium]|nr:AarF/UbiB family protein [Thermoleophilia bacterium]